MEKRPRNVTGGERGEGEREGEGERRERGREEGGRRETTEANILHGE